MKFLVILTYLFAGFMGALALPQVHFANPDLQIREQVGCGIYKSENRPDGNLLLKPECANLDGHVYLTRVDNPKCALCLMFSEGRCSGKMLWIGGGDRKDKHYNVGQPRSYFCQTTFP